MIKPEQIPKEVVEAMARNRAIRNEDDDRYWPDYADGVEADLLAGLNAWPDVVDTHPNNIGHLVLQFKKVSDD